MARPLRGRTPQAGPSRVGLRQIAGHARELLTRPVSLWRRSVQFRVVTSVLVLSAVVTSIVGLQLLNQITNGLVQNRVKAAVAEANTESAVADERLRQAGASDFDPAAQLRQLVSSLVDRGKVRGFDVVVVGPVGPGSGAGQVAGVRTSPEVSLASVPKRLRTVVERREGTSWTYTRIDYLADSAREDVPGVAVGDQVVLPSDGGTYAVYLLFPMTEELATVSLLRSALLTAGVLLLLLLAALTWLVTRQVVAPIRMVRRVAERISSGRLEERMSVKGVDDIARLSTSVNHMADALQKQIRQLEELSRVQRRFVSDVSHELRTPLTTVRMAGDILHDERENFEPVAARAAELLQAELNRFEGMLADLLEISRFDAGAAGLEVDDVNLTEVARSVIASTEPLAAKRGVQVRLLDDGPVMAEADVRRVERIVRNLVTNAIDHAEAGDVEIRVAAAESTAALSVRDHGVGLAPGESAMVFNRFWRADPARARTTGGTGLGLAIALEDARLHGGKLQAWGLLGKGALFRLTLPRKIGDRVGRSPLPLVPEDVKAGDQS